MKYIILTLFFQCSFALVNAQVQEYNLTPANATDESTLEVVSKNPVTTEQRDNLIEKLEEFNIEKITDVKYNATTFTFTVTHTSKLNKIELLEIFKSEAVNAYFIEGGNVYRLNGLGTDLISTPHTIEE